MSYRQTFFNIDQQFIQKLVLALIALWAAYSAGALQASRVQILTQKENFSWSCPLSLPLRFLSVWICPIIIKGENGQQ